MPAIKRKRSSHTVQTTNVSTDTPVSSAKKSQNEIAYLPFQSLEDLKSAISSHSPDALAHELQRMRFVFQLSPNETPGKDSSKFKILFDYLDDIPPCQDLFNIWESAIQQKAWNVSNCIPGVFSTILSILDQIASFRDLGHGLIRRILTTDIYSQSLKTMLESDRPHQIINSIRLLYDCVSFGEGMAILEVIDTFEIKALPKLLSMRRSVEDNQSSLHRPDIRILYILYIMSLLRYGPTHVKKTIVEAHNLVGGILIDLHADHVTVIQHVITTLHERIMADPKIPRTSKIRLFSPPNLKNLSKIYVRTEIEEIDKNQKIIPADLVHHFLLAICCHPGSGVCFHDAGWYPPSSMTLSNLSENQQTPKLFNKILSSFIISLRPTEDLRQMELLLRILGACPELVEIYWCATPLTFEPRLSSRWLSNIALVGKVVSLSPPSLFHPGTSFYPLEPPLSTTIVESILPSCVPKVYLTKAIQSSSRLVQLAITIFLNRVLRKLHTVTTLYTNVIVSIPDSSTTWQKGLKDIQVAIKSRMVDIQMVIALQQTLSSDAAKASADSPLLYESVTRLLKLSLKLLPDTASELTFDVGKLIGHGIVSQSSSQFFTMATYHILELVSRNPDCKFTNKSSKQSVLSHLGELMQSYLMSTQTHVKEYLRDCLFQILASTPFFDHNPREIHVWIDAFPSSNFEVVLEFFDDCVIRIVRMPFGYYDSLNQLVGLRSKVYSSVSPLLMTLIEQWKYCQANNHISDEGKFDVIMFITKVVFGCLKESSDPEILSKAMTLLREDSGGSKPWTFVLENVAQILQGKTEGSINQQHQGNVQALVDMSGLPSWDMKEQIIKNGLFWPKLVEDALTIVQGERMDRLYDSVPFELYFYSMSPENVGSSHTRSIVKTFLQKAQSIQRLEGFVRIMCNWITKKILDTISYDDLTTVFDFVHEGFRIAMKKDWTMDVMKKIVFGDQMLEVYMGSSSSEALINFKALLIRSMKEIMMPKDELDFELGRSFIKHLIKSQDTLLAQVTGFCTDEELLSLWSSSTLDVDFSLFNELLLELDQRGLTKTWQSNDWMKFINIWVGELSVSDDRLDRIVIGSNIALWPSHGVFLLCNLSFDNVSEWSKSRTRSRILSKMIEVDYVILKKFSQYISKVDLTLDQVALWLEPLEAMAEVYNTIDVDFELRETCTFVLERIFVHIIRILMSKKKQKLDQQLAYRIAKITAVHADENVLLQVLSDALNEVKGACMNLNVLLLIKLLIKEKPRYFHGTQFSKTYVDKSLMWLVRRFSEDPGTSDELLCSIEAFTDILEEIGGSKILSFGTVEPVLISAIQNRLDEPVIITLLCRLFDLFQHSSELVARCLQSITVHEQFKNICGNTNTTLDPNSRKVQDAGRAISKLLWIIFHRDPRSSCRAEYLDTLIQVYKGTLSLADQYLLDIFTLYERTTNSSVALRLSIFGSSFIHHKISSRVYAIQHGSYISDIVAGLDGAMLQKTIQRFSPPRSLQGIDISVDDDSCYDPRFILLLLNSVIGQVQQGSNLRGLFAANVVGVAIMCLSSSVEAVRKAAVSVVAELRSVLRKSNFREQPQVLWLLDALMNAIPTDRLGETPLPLVIAVFVAQGLIIQMNPGHSLYTRLNEFLLARPFLDIKDIPLFYNLLFSAGNGYKRDRRAILQMIGCGLASDDDYSLYRRRHVFDLLMSGYASPQIDLTTKKMIIDVFYETSKSSCMVATDMISNRGLLSWIFQQACTSEEDMLFVWPRLMLHLLKMADMEKVQRRLRTTWSTTAIGVIRQIVGKLDMKVKSLIMLNAVHASLKLLEYVARIAKSQEPSLFKVDDFATEIVSILEKLKGDIKNQDMTLSLPEDNLWNETVDVSKTKIECMEVGFYLGITVDGKWSRHVDYFISQLPIDHEIRAFARRESIKACYRGRLAVS